MLTTEEKANRLNKKKTTTTKNKKTQDKKSWPRAGLPWMIARVRSVSVLN